MCLWLEEWESFMRSFPLPPSTAVSALKAPFPILRARQSLSQDCAEVCFCLPRDRDAAAVNGVSTLLWPVCVCAPACLVQCGVWGELLHGAYSCPWTGSLAPDLLLHPSPLPCMCPDLDLFSRSWPAGWPRCSVPVTQHLERERWRCDEDARHTSTLLSPCERASAGRDPEKSCGTVWARRKAFTQQRRKLEQ